MRGGASVLEIRIITLLFMTAMLLWYVAGVLLENLLIWYTILKEDKGYDLIKLIIFIFQHAYY